MKPRVAPLDEVFEALHYGAPRLVRNAALLLAARWPADAPAPLLIAEAPAPDIVWVAWLGAVVTPGNAPARPYYLRPPDVKPQVSPLQFAPQPSA